jgi:ABC-type dipeptide/oligopeptide/nickel transport system permease component
MGLIAFISVLIVGGYMFKFLAKRLFSGLVALFVFMTVLFFLIQVVMPGNFATQYAANESDRETALKLIHEAEVRLGLNLSLWQQYLRWLWGFLRFDLGTSFYGYPVWEILKNLLTSTLFIFGLGLITAFLIGQSLAELSFKIKSRLFSGLLSFMAVSLDTAFPPWLAFLIILLLAGVTVAVQSQTYINPLVAFSMLMQSYQLVPARTLFVMFFSLVGFGLLFFYAAYLFEKKTHCHIIRIIPIGLGIASAVGLWYALGFWNSIPWLLLRASFPFITFTLIFTGETFLIFRNNMMEVKNENFVLFAKAIGEPAGTVIRRHIVRNSFFAVLSNAVVSFPYILTGLIIIEKCTNWSGLGTAVFFAFSNQDMPLIMGILFVMGVISLVLRLALDVIQVILDPRLRRLPNQSEVEL